MKQHQTFKSSAPSFIVVHCLSTYYTMVCCRLFLRQNRPSRGDWSAYGLARWLQRRQLYVVRNAEYLTVLKQGMPALKEPLHWKY